MRGFKDTEYWKSIAKVWLEKWIPMACLAILLAYLGFQPLTEKAFQVLAP